MKAKILIIFCLFFLLVSPIWAQESCILKGKWKSNEEATLREMAKNKNLTEKQIAFLSNNFFGKLIIDYTCSEFTSYYEGESTTFKYKIIHQNKNFLVAQYYDNILKQNLTKEVEIKGDCYYTPLAGLGFKEVFCKVE